MNRETWLNKLAEMMAPRFTQIGYPLKKFRVAVGFGSNGQRSKSAAEVWHASVSDDDTFEIFVMPDQVDSELVACHLAHELTHVAVGFEEGHKGKFAAVALELGLKRPMTATTPGDAFKAYIKPFLDELGPLPHAKLRFNRNGKDGARPGSVDGESVDAPPRRVGEKSTRAPTQSTRLKKAECGLCGYTVRVTQKWLEKGPPHCPDHGAMDVDIDIDELEAA